MHQLLDLLEFQHRFEGELEEVHRVVVLVGHCRAHVAELLAHGRGLLHQAAMAAACADTEVGDDDYDDAGHRVAPAGRVFKIGIFSETKKCLF